MVWQPIETVPNGDFNIAIDMFSCGERVTDCFWGRPDEYRVIKKEEYCWCYGENEVGYGWVVNRVRNPTHWMPVPSDPTKS